MKRHLLPLLLALLLTPAWAGSENEPTTTSLFSDMHFEQGFLLSYPSSEMGRKVEAVLDYGNPENKPLWRLCQWATRYTLASATCSRLADGSFAYVNQGKQVNLSPDRTLTLRLNGAAEYGPHARKSNEPWPHLLIEQDAPQTFALSALRAINFSVSARLSDFANHMQSAEYNPGLHAAQFQMFFIVKNIAPDSADSNNFFWFGIPFFDSRHDLPVAFMAKDGGKADATGKFIYTIAGKETNLVPMKNRTWVQMKKDLLPHIKNGLKVAVERHYLTDADPSHYAVVNMNLGWEMPGTFDAAIQIKDLQIIIIRKP